MHERHRVGGGEAAGVVSDAMPVAPKGSDDPGGCDRILISHDDALPVEGIGGWGTHGGPLDPEMVRGWQDGAEVLDHIYPAVLFGGLLQARRHSAREAWASPC